MRFIYFLIVSAFLFLGSCAAPEIPIAKPNIILVLVDDMGYSDLGCMGSEIETPHLDSLAQNGLLFTQAYNTSRCCPSRASLMTGIYQHQAGVGAMNHNLGHPSYQGFLNRRYATIPEMLRPAGYRTIMTGKWHIGDARENWPDKRGFDEFYGIPAGGGLYFSPSPFIDRPVFENGKEIVPDSTAFYSTDAFTDAAIRMIDDEVDQQPFFLYLAYIAPHYPLQAWPEDIEKYEGQYDDGYEGIRMARFEKQQRLGVLPKNLTLSKPDYPAWDSITDKALEKRKMQVYAAQMDRLDQNIGKLTNHLRRRGQLENTLIIFLSDNGGCAEEVNRSGDNPIGGADSFVAYGKNWANVSNTPYREYKQFEHEGGIITPMIVHWPKQVTNGRIVKDPVHIMDVFPTLLDITGIEYPADKAGEKLVPLQGESLYSLLKGSDDALPQRTLFWEHLGNRAVRSGDWKLVAFKNQPWTLFNLADDPTELHNLIETESEIARSMQSAYETWAQENEVLDWEGNKLLK